MRKSNTEPDIGSVKLMNRRWKTMKKLEQARKQRELAQAKEAATKSNIGTNQDQVRAKEPKKETDGFVKQQGNPFNKESGQMKPKEEEVKAMQSKTESTQNDERKEEVKLSEVNKTSNEKQQAIESEINVETENAINQEHLKATKCVTKLEKVTKKKEEVEVREPSTETVVRSVEISVQQGQEKGSKSSEDVVTAAGEILSQERVKVSEITADPFTRSTAQEEDETKAPESSSEHDTIVVEAEVRRGGGKRGVLSWLSRTWNLDYGKSRRRRVVGNDRLSRKEGYSICCMLTTENRNEELLAHAASRLDELYRVKIFPTIAYSALCRILTHPANNFSPFQNMLVIVRWCRWSPNRRNKAQALRAILSNKGLSIPQRVSVGLVAMRHRDLFG